MKGILNLILTHSPSPTIKNANHNTCTFVHPILRPHQAKFINSICVAKTNQRSRIWSLKPYKAVSSLHNTIIRNTHLITLVLIDTNTSRLV